MKKIVPFKLLAFFLVFTSIKIAAQPGNGNGNAYGLGELSFSNPTLLSGTAGANNAVYKFANVNTDLDAHLRIVSRSSSQVTLSEVDVTNTGFAKAFQPRVVYNNGNASGAVNYWIEFQITFVVKNTMLPANINGFKVTAIDVDGNNGSLRETNSFYNFNTYTVESNSALTVTNILANVLGVLTTVGKTFTSPSVEYGGIDTTATDVMATMDYNNTNSFNFRVGATTSGSTNNANRLSSFWFKNFQYSNGNVGSLPLQLVSFNAVLNKNKVDLKWTTMNEENVSHFIVEKSYDGKEFSDAGMVMAYGNTTESKNYSLSNDVSRDNGILYYRLRSYDVDSKTQLSSTKIIRLSQKESLSLVTYPNPVSNELRVTFPASWQNKEVRIHIYNANGQQVAARNVAAAGQTETFNFASLPKGYYVVKAVNALNETAQQAIIKN